MRKLGKYILLTVNELEEIKEEAQKDIANKYLMSDLREIEKYREETEKKLEQKRKELEAWQRLLETTEKVNKEEINNIRRELKRCRETIGTLKAIIKDKKMAYLRQLAKSVDQGRLKRELKKANKELIALEMVIRDSD